MKTSLTADVDRAMNELVTQQRIPGGIVVIARRGKIVHEKAYGKMDLEADKPMRTDSILRFYSMTKAITTAAAMMLADDGKLKVTDPVAKYIPQVKDVSVAFGDETRAATQEMTVADLMRHTSGYSYGKTGESAHDNAYGELNLLDTSTTLVQMSEKLGQQPLLFEPATDWKYGISIDVLGRVVEVASGKRLRVFLDERIFTPLDMRDTAFFVARDKLDRFAANYTAADAGKLTLLDAPATSRYLLDPPFDGGGGGLVSTARDYMRFLMMISQGGQLHGKRLLRDATVKQMIVNQVPRSVGWVKFGDEVREGVGFGFGFSVREKMSDWDPQGRVGEYGWGGAASTHFWVSPKDDLIVITLEQVMPYSFMTETKLKGIIYDAIIE